MSSDFEINVDTPASITNVRREVVTPEKYSKLTKSTRKRKRRYYSSDEEEFDTSIDTKLKQSAMRNNLTPQNVKNILQKVVRNDHVLAIVKLKEEELERQEQAMKDLKAVVGTASTGPNSHSCVTIVAMEKTTPKLTRAKAKALNKYPLPVAPFKHSEPDSEVVALIREELHSDDDDEEYQPGEDDVESDDDVNTTVSDIDSQPATPSSQIDASEEPSITYSHDGLFKLPRARNDSTASHSEQEYIIAQRTRSKISLAETPIEAIESTFKAPDAPLDMYQHESDSDPIWNQFLTNFSMPLTTEMEKDEDTDPDYLPATVDSQPADREEFQHGNVPRKEVYDLFAELFADVPIDSWGLHDIPDSFLLDSLPPKQVVTTDENLNESLVTPVKQLDEPLTVHQTSMLQEQTEFKLQPNESPTLNNQLSISFFDPNVISTPGKTNFKHSTISSSQQSQPQSLDSFNSTLLSVNDYSFNGYSMSPLQDSAIASSSACNKLTLPYTPQVLVTLSPQEATTTSPMFSTNISSIPLKMNNQVPDLQNRQIEVKSAQSKLGYRSKRSRIKNAAYKELERLHPNTIEPPTFFGADERGFTAEQKRILEYQLRVHVQLATQSYLQTYGHPTFYPEAPKIRRFLTDFVDFDGNATKNPVSICNLKPALELIDNWENELSHNTKENTEWFTYLQNEMEKLRKNMSYTMKFNERLLNVISTSKVFMYPELLPAIPFRFNTSKPSEYFPGEDYLIAFLLDHFFVELQQKMFNYKFAKPKEVTLTSVCHNISAHLGYLRHWKSIYDYVRLRRDGESINPIKFYFLHRKAPPPRHRYEIFDPQSVIEPAKQPLNALSEQWAGFVEKLINLSHDEVLNRFNRLPVNPNSQNNGNKQIKRTLENPKSETKNQFCVKILPENPGADDSLFQVKIVYEQSATDNSYNISNYKAGAVNTCGHKCDPNDISGYLEKGQALLTSYFQPIKKTNDLNAETLSYQIEIDAPSDNQKTDEKWHLRRNQRICRKIHRKYTRLNISKYLIRTRTVVFLVRFAQNSRKEYSSRWQWFRKNSKVSFIYQCLITYHRFTNKFLNHSKPSIETKTANMTTETLVNNRRIHKILNDNTVKETLDENNMHTGQQQSDVGTKRIQTKNQRISENNRLLLAENAHETSEKDFLFAQRFLDRVEETFINENKHHKCVEFLEILRNFRENQHKKSGADLYLILEQFFMPDYPELIEIFLNFMTPSDAIEINQSMEHFLKVNLSKFLNKLNIFYQKQPAQIRKVLTCLKELSEDPDVTIEKIKSKILPLLKGNQLLIDWFLQCVGPDKCESSKDEYETLVLRKGNESFDDDQFEYIPQSEIVADPNDNPCHIRYMNGRIFYGNRFPLPAKLSFSATPCSSFVNDDATSGDQHLLIGVGSQYHCVHNIKEFADNKMRDKNHLELEPVGGVGPSDDIDNSDEEQQYVTPEKIDDKKEEDEVENGISYASTEHNLCDNTLLRAHSVRLNPSMHTSLLQTNADLLNKLKAQEQSLGENYARELKLSPKKQSLAKCSTSTQIKSSQNRKINSPNAKKAVTVTCKSPNSKKIVTHTSTEHMETGNSAQVPESNAIQMAKKLKRILEINEPTPSCSNVEDASKYANNSSPSSKRKELHSKPIKKQKRAHEYYDSGDEGEYAEDMTKKEKIIENDATGKSSEVLEIQWTREEDRLLLEQIKAGLVSHTENIAGFAGRFPNKTQEQIRDRIDFLFDFLTKLRNKK